MWWVPWWWNYMKLSGSCLRAELATILILVNLFIDVLRLARTNATQLVEIVAELQERFAVSSDKSSEEQLFFPADTASLNDFLFAAEPAGVQEPTNEDEDDARSRDDGDVDRISLNSDDDDDKVDVVETVGSAEQSNAGDCAEGLNMDSATSTTSSFARVPSTGYQTSSSSSKQSTKDYSESPKTARGLPSLA